MGNGKFGHALGRVCGRELQDNSYCDGVGDHASLGVSKRGQTTWYCTKCRSSNTVTRFSPMWLAAVELYNALPSTKKKI